MSEIKPTMENLMDPYVLQLIEALGRRDDEIERLEAERLAFATESEMRQADYNEAREEVTTYSLLLEEAQARVEELEAALKGEMVACLCGDPLCPDGPRHRTGEGDE